MLTRPRGPLLLRAALVSLLAAVLLSAPARLLAHPMGNFSISHYAGITVERGFIELRYLLDFAEIPTFQELQQSGVDPQPNDPKIPAYLAVKSAEFARGLHLTVNGRALDLRDVGHSVIFPPGAGNLPTMKFGFIYRAELPADCTPAAPCHLEYEDANFSSRAGWKEVIAEAALGATLVTSTVPAKDRSLQLSNYPTDLLNSPPQVLRAAVTFTVEPAPASATSAVLPESRGSASRASDGAEPRTAAKGPPANLEVKPNDQATPRNAFTELMGTKEISFSVAWLAAIIAMGLGALHAFEPGHGKTIVAAYLVGGKGTARDAIFLGTIVTLSHTSGVYLLGAITLYAQKYIVPDQLYPFLGVLSGLLIAGMGLYLFLQRYAGKSVLGHSHTHSHGPIGHSHEHGASDVHAHDHAPPDHVHHDHVSADHSHADPHDHHHADAKPSIAQLLILGITGGIVPCPAALVVLLSAVALHRVGFGLFLIVAFSLGLAAVLIAMGLIAVYARRLMSRVPAEGPLIQRWLPLTSAAMITILGCVIAVRGLIAAGIVQIHL